MRSTRDTNQWDYIFDKFITICLTSIKLFRSISFNSDWIFMFFHLSPFDFLWMSFAWFKTDNRIVKCHAITFQDNVICWKRQHLQPLSLFSVVVVQMKCPKILSFERLLWSADKKRQPKWKFKVKILRSIFKRSFWKTPWFVRELFNSRRAQYWVFSTKLIGIQKVSQKSRTFQKPII